MHTGSPLTLDVDVDSGGHLGVLVEALVSSGVVSNHSGNCECLTEQAVTALRHLHPSLRGALVVGPDPVQLPLSSETISQAAVSGKRCTMRLSLRKQSLNLQLLKVKAIRPSTHAGSLDHEQK